MSTNRVAEVQKAVQDDDVNVDRFRQVCGRWCAPTASAKRPPQRAVPHPFAPAPTAPRNARSARGRPEQRPASGSVGRRRSTAAPGKCCHPRPRLLRSTQAKTKSSSSFDAVNERRLQCAPSGIELALVALMLALAAAASACGSCSAIGNAPRADKHTHTFTARRVSAQSTSVAATQRHQAPSRV